MFDIDQLFTILSFGTKELRQSPRKHVYAPRSLND
jgi:hypothetical protein